MKTIPLDIWQSWASMRNDGGPIETTGDYALIINIIFLALIVPTVCLRVYARAFSSRWLGLDDIFIVFGLLFAIGLSTASIVANYKYFCNVHIWDEPFQYWTVNLKLAIVAKVMFVTAGAFVRQSLLHFYLRLIGDADLRKIRWSIHIATFLNVSTLIIFNAISIFQCNPIWAYWTYPSDLYGTCMDEGATVVACGSVVAALDVIILLLPLRIITQLQMPLRRKIGVGILLNLGLVAVAAAILRIYYSWKAFVQTYDITWYATPVWVCATIEVDLAIMCACAPALRTFLHEHFPGAIKPFRSLGNAITALFTKSRSSKKSSEHSSATVFSTNERKDETQYINPDKDSKSQINEKNAYYADMSDLERGDSSSNDERRPADGPYRTIDQEAVLFAAHQAIQGLQPLPSHLLDVHSRPVTRDVHDLAIDDDDQDGTISLGSLDEHTVQRSRSGRTQRTQQTDMTQPPRSSDEMDLPVRLVRTIESAYSQEAMPTRTASGSSRHSRGITSAGVSRNNSYNSRRSYLAAEDALQQPRSSSRASGSSRPTSMNMRDHPNPFRSEWAARQEANMLAARQARRVDVPLPTQVPPPRHSLPPIPAQSQSAVKPAPSRQASAPLTDPDQPNLAEVSSNTSSKHGGQATFLLDESSAEGGEEDERRRELLEKERQRRRDLVGSSKRAT